MRDDTFYGSADQQALLRRGRGLFDLLRDAKDVGYYGRMVGLLRPRAGSASRLAALVGVQGAANYAHVTPEQAPATRASLEAAGYSITEYAKWVGGPEAVAKARALLRDVPLPVGISITKIHANSPPDALDALAGVALGCGVLPIAGSMLRGMLRPGVGLVARTSDGVPVACGAAAQYAPTSDAELGDEAWWGMLATDPSHRGQRLALILGAMAIVDMEERFGFSHFMTGVVPGNAASEAVCAKVGLADRGARIFTVVDAAALPGGKLTR